MGTSVVYNNAGLYESVMRLLYGRHYAARYRTIADLIPEDATVFDTCCGPATIHSQYLRSKSVDYTGIDLNSQFVARLNRLGVVAHVWDLRDDRPLPKAEYVIMQASLYHFLPDVGSVVDRMLEAASKQVIIAEPIRNLSTSQLPVLAWCAKHLTNAGSGPQEQRFTKETLDDFFAKYAATYRSCLISGGREKVYVLSKGDA